MLPKYRKILTPPTKRWNGSCPCRPVKGLLPSQIGTDNNNTELFIEANEILCRYVDSKMILYNFHCHALSVCYSSADDGKASHNNDSVAAWSMAFHLSAGRKSCFDLGDRSFHQTTHRAAVTNVARDEQDKCRSPNNQRRVQPHFGAIDGSHATVGNLPGNFEP